MNILTKPIMTPNQITLSRLGLTIILFALWFASDDQYIRLGICGGFIAIFVADAWDGVVARKYNLSSLMGVCLDPVVDVISYAALALLLIDAGLLPLWFFFIYLTVTSLAGFVKQYAAAQNRVVSASILAKVKADLVSVPLAGWFIIHNVDTIYQPWVVIGVAIYLFGFKFIFDPDEKHTFAIRSTLAFLIIAFLLRPQTVLITEYYGSIYLILATIMHIGSTSYYFWDNRSLFIPEEIVETLEKRNILTEQIVSHETVGLD